MARKKFELGDPEGIPLSPPKKKKELFDNPLEQTRSGRQKASKVAGRKTDALGRVRKTIYLDPTTLDDIEALVESEGYGKMDFFEWLILMGIQQFEKGVRPEIEDKPVVKARIKIDR